MNILRLSGSCTPLSGPSNHIHSMRRHSLLMTLELWYCPTLVGSPSFSRGEAEAELTRSFIDCLAWCQRPVGQKRQGSDSSLKPERTRFGRHHSSIELTRSMPIDYSPRSVRVSICGVAGRQAKRPNRF